MPCSYPGFTYPSLGRRIQYCELFPVCSLHVGSATWFSFDSHLKALGTPEPLLFQAPEPALESCGSHFPGYCVNTTPNSFLWLELAKAHPSASAQAGEKTEVPSLQSGVPRSSHRGWREEKHMKTRVQREKSLRTPHSVVGATPPSAVKRVWGKCWKDPDVVWESKSTFFFVLCPILAPSPAGLKISIKKQNTKSTPE